MKLVAGSGLLAALALLDPIAADFKLMKQGYKKLIAQLRQTNRDLRDQNFGNLNGYGCWCYFDDKVGNGKASPVDPIDNECRNLHRNYECAIADHGETCVPWSVTYFPVLGTSFIAQQGSITAACHHTNTVLTQFGDCAKTACIIETHFTNEYTTITQSYNPNFATFSHHIFQAGTNPPNTVIIGSNPNFDPEKKCKSIRKYEKDKSPRQCCGVYPTRYPFKAFSYQPTKTQACCVDEVYSVNNQCCVSGSVQPKNGPCP